MADWCTVPLLNAENGKHPKRIGLAHPSISPYGVFRTQDGMFCNFLLLPYLMILFMLAQLGFDILISIQSEREWQVFCKIVLESPDMPKDPRFENNVERVKNRSETDGTVARIFGTLSRDVLMKRLTGNLFST